MLQGYVDDSGSEGTREPFIVGGYLAQVEVWAHFSDAWKAELDREPQIRYFKMREAAAGNGEFAGVPMEVRRYKIRNLLKIIKDHDLDGVYSFLEWSDYRNSILPRLRGPMRNPFSLLFYGVLDAIILYEKQKGIFPETVDLDFDEQGEAGHFAILLYPLVKRDPSPDIQAVLGRTPTMLNDINVVPLQAADMLAWNVRRHGDRLSDSEFEWVYEEIHQTVWLGAGFGKPAYEAMLRYLDSREKERAP